jgi:hypothetical protein
MADAIPTKLKGLQLAPFAKRAAQLEKFKPIVTYWCMYLVTYCTCCILTVAVRFHMVQKIIASGLHSADQECTAYTTDLMEKLEAAKAQHPDEDAILDDIAASPADLRKGRPRHDGQQGHQVRIDIDSW